MLTPRRCYNMKWPNTMVGLTDLGASLRSCRDALGLMSFACPEGPRRWPSLVYLAAPGDGTSL